MNSKPQRCSPQQKQFRTLSLGALMGMTGVGCWLGGQLPAVAVAHLAQAIPKTKPTAPAKTVPAAPIKPAPAAPVVPAPPALVEWFKQLDAATSRKDIEDTLKFYSPSFTHADGLDANTFRAALQTFWQNTSAQYTTKIDNWKAQGSDQYVVETTTTLKGKQTAAERDMALESTVRSRLTIANQQIVAQETLSEQSRLTFGEKPPEVTISLPEEVKVGQTFNFDAIVKAPLGNDLLLGAAVEEPITPARYQQPATVALEPLSSGGLFKVGQAPSQPTRQWVSAVLIQGNGMTIISQRLNVVKAAPVAPATPR
jgi:hypothetical protein